MLLAANGRQFCAGGDIDEFAERRADLERLIGEMLDALHPAIHTLATLPVPVISAVQGPIGGAGIAVALCADFVLASPAGAGFAVGARCHPFARREQAAV